MRRTTRLRGGADLLTRWRANLGGGQTLSRESALQLMQETVDEAHTSADGRKKPLLATRRHSVMIWKSLGQHHIPWADCLGLLEAQLAAVSPAQRRFLQDSLADEKQLGRLPHLVIAMWQHLADLSAVYAHLMAAETIVRFASLVQIAVRERPQLGGVLPVTPCVLMRCYELGKAQPEVALECCRGLALVNAETVPRREKEALALAYAMLHANSGCWSMALSVVNAAREVRPSAKRLFWLYTKRTSQWEKALSSTQPVERQVVVESIKHAPGFSCALKVYEKWESHEAAVALLARPDCISAMGWEAALRLCHKAHVCTYSILRHILAGIPADHPQLMQLHTSTIRLGGDSMYAGTLTRRAHTFIKKSQWSEAIGLLCGCRYYDVALPLAPHVPRGVALPHELLAYEEAVHRAKMSLTPANAAFFEEKLAVALHGDWTQLKELPDNARLHSLILARRARDPCGTEGVKDSSGVQCFTFHSEELSRLVCLRADRKAQRYFMQVIPSVLRLHHFGTECIPEPEPDARGQYVDFFLSDNVVSGRESCNALCAMLVRHLQTSGKLTELAFLREIAKCLAAGKVRLAAADRHELPLAVLRAATHFHRANAAMTARIAISTPSQHLTAHTEALESSMNAFVLNGQWERAISLIQRTKRPYPESFGSVAYVVPHAEARKILRLIWKDNAESRWLLLLQDLLHGDVRLAQDELASVSSVVWTSRDSKRTQWRRRVLGACCALLQSSESMCMVVRAAKTSAFSSLDVDEHGLTRLLRVLPWELAVTAVTDLQERGEVVEELWILAVCTKPSIPLDSIKKLVAWLPYSTLLHAVLVYQEAGGQGDLCMAVKAIARYQTVMLTEYWSSDAYLRPFVLLLKDVLLRFDDEAWERISLWPIVRRMFNKIVEESRFTHLGRKGRNSIPLALREDGPCAAQMITGFLYHQLSRTLQVPISASITSRLLRSVALRTSDHQSALHFFKSLKHPSDEERRLLVFALRDTDDAMTVLLNTGRFVRPRPDQVLLWSDQRLGEERWRESLKLLSQSPPPEEQLTQLCSGWTSAECLHALELLRRTHGSSPEAEPYVALVKKVQVKEPGQE
ncbi:hypothetical protein DQ04_03481030 [Trypanosoma grayi]|uniref:hypothetical protein n=1 Tax=Trypanosoma grayi TaxID=71804 RepID=UPI0004F49393|nr:hypothetical protein DQ04_03481030 [Trypanosoma grayi]KEG10633.1 hypothetical protein DQ04_03481030 [Trypanosoma grayi]